MRKNIRHITGIRMWLLGACIFVCSLTCITQAASAQAKPGAEYQLKAVFLYNFTQFIDWPPTAFEAYNDPFVIGIIGDDPFGIHLEEAISGEAIRRHPIIIKRYSDAKQIENCQVLFINLKDESSIRNTLLTISNRNILTVSDAQNFARIGGMIGFFTENNKIRMQINTNAAKNAQLTISSKLLSVAQVL